MELALTTQFMDQKVDFLKDDNGDIILDMEQLTQAVGFKNERRLKELLENYPELLEREYSYKVKLLNTEGGIEKMRTKRVFTEQGVYEVTFLASTKKAREFRRFAGSVLKALRKGELTTNKTSLFTPENKLDLIVNKISEREELMEQLANDSEKIVNLLLELKGKVKTLDAMDERLKAVEKSQATLNLTLQDFLRVMGEEGG